MHGERARGSRELARVRRARAARPELRWHDHREQHRPDVDESTGGRGRRRRGDLRDVVRRRRSGVPCPWLPQRIELASIVDYSRHYMALNPLFFTNAADGNTAWTATTFMPTSTWWVRRLRRRVARRTVPGRRRRPGPLRARHDPSTRRALHAADERRGGGRSRRSRNGPHLEAAQRTRHARLERGALRVHQALSHADDLRAEHAGRLEPLQARGRRPYLRRHGQQLVSHVERPRSPLPRPEQLYIDFATGAAGYTGNNWPGDPYQVRCVR